MPFETDQSGRIEETNRDTIVAIGNASCQFSLRIPAKIKRTLKQNYKAQGKPKLFAYKTFALAVALLVNKSQLKTDDLTIDIEYPGHEPIISEIIGDSVNRDININFKKIGKSSPAHVKAYFTYKGKLKADFVAKIEELSGDKKF